MSICEIIVTIGTIAWIGMIAAIAYAICTAPEGHEDKDGYHKGPKP